MQVAPLSIPTSDELFEAAPTGMLVCQALRDASGRLVDFQGVRVNAAAARLLGIPRDRFLTQPFLSVQPGARESGLFDRYVAVVEGGPTTDAPIFLDNHWYSGSTIRIGDGFMVSFLNIDATQAALQREAEARALLQGTLDASPWAVVYLEPVREAAEVTDFVFRMANAASVQIGKRPLEDLLGQRLLDLYPHTRSSGLFAAYVRVLETGEPFATEIEYVAPQEDIRAWSQIHAVRQADGLVITTVDITEAKRGQQLIQQQAELVRNVLDGSLTSVAALEAVRDAQGELIDLRYTAVNRQIEQITGRTSAELIGQRLCELFPGVKTSGLFERWKAIVETGHPDHFEWRYDQDGYHGWYDCTGVRHGDGLIQSYVDISDRKQAELQSQEMASLLQGVLDASPLAINYLEAVPDEAGRPVDFIFRIVNPASTLIGQQEPAALLGRRLTEAYPTTRTNGVLDQYRRVLETGETWRQEMPYEGEGLAGWYTFVVVRQGAGLVTIINDISDRKQAELEKQRQAEQFTQIIDNTLTGLIQWEAVRDERGSVVDLRALFFNQAGCEMARITPEQFQTRTFLELDPEGLFSEYVRVIETGDPLHAEYYFEEINTWFDVTAAKLDDGLIVSFSNVTLLKQAQDALRQQAEILDGVLNNTLNGIIHWEAVRDGAGQLTDFRARLFNRAAVDTGGLSEADLRSGTLRELSPDGLFDQYRHVLETGESLRVEHYFPEVDGWFDLSAARLGDGLVVCFNDVSAVRESVLERQQHAETLEALLDGALNGIWALEARRSAFGHVEDFVITAANRAAAQITGRPLHELAGVRLLTAYPANKQMGFFQHYVEVLETGLPQRFVQHYHADGIDNWYDVSVTRQDPDRLVVAFVDVTEAKRAHQTLVGESALFQTLSSHVPETGVLVVSTSGRIQFANGVLPALFDDTPQESLPECRLGNVLLPRYRAEVLDALRQALNGQPSQISTQVGESFYEAYYGPVRNADGQVVMAMATFRDVTRDRRYQQQLKASNENLERFAYVASHDLQEPLRKIQSFGDMLYRKQRDALDATSLNYIERMQSAAGRMMILINDLLAYSRVSSKSPTFERVELPAVLRAIKSDLDVAVREKGATLRIASLPTLTGDGTQLRQLFQNLVSNALKFSRPDAPPVVEIRYRTVPADQLPAGTEPLAGERFHEICVVDNGIGFEPQYAARIFEAFQRLHGRSEYPGTGIGLAIVKKVVENHRGTIAVDSTPGQGSAFQVYLPMSE